jgi:hypothetical protein
VRDVSLTGLYGRYLYADFGTGDLRSLSLGLPAASDDRSEGLSVTRPTTFGQDAACRIYVASFNGPVYRLNGPSGGAAASCPTGMGLKPLKLDLWTKRQALTRRLSFTATASSNSTLLGTGRAIARVAKPLVGNQPTKIEVRLRRGRYQRLLEQLDKRGEASVKVAATATDQHGRKASDEIRVKLASVSNRGTPRTKPAARGRPVKTSDSA